MTARAWILILVLASIQALLLAPHRHASGLEEKACVGCQTAKAATLDLPAAPALVLPRPDVPQVEERTTASAPLLSPILECGNPRSPPTV